METLLKFDSFINKARRGPFCRLCYSEARDNIDIYSSVGLLYECDKKIQKYLYLQISRNDQYSKILCLVCLQHLETFHKFYDKVNDAQKRILKEKYDSIVLKAIYHNATIVLNPELEPCYNIHDRDSMEAEMPAVSSAEEPEVILDCEEFEEYDINSAELSREPDKTGSIVTHNEREDDNENDITTGKKLSTSAESDTQIYLSLVNPKDMNLANYIIKIEPKLTDEVPTTSQSTAGTSYMTRSKICTSTAANSCQNSNELESVPPPSTPQHPLEPEDEEDVDNPHEDEYIPAQYSGDDDSEEADNSFAMKRRRGRPKGVRNKMATDVSLKRDVDAVVQADKLPVAKVKRETKISDCTDDEAEVDGVDNDDAAARAIAATELREGESENEFPARDSDNEDWPAQETLNKFPCKIIENGLLLIKGKKLKTMICKFYKLECDLCPNEKPRFRELASLFHHYTSVHKEEGYVICCQTKFSRYPAIIMHMARHIQPDAFKCEICGYMVTRPRFLESHRQTHLAEEEKPFGCDQCPRRFCWKGALNIHLISHQPVEERKLYVCHMCGKTYDTPGGLSTHKKLAHTERRPESNVCHVCAKIFATRTGLNEHMMTIHQPREKNQVQCPECGKWLMNNRCLKSHMALHSSVFHNCEMCDYKTRKALLLKRHLMTQHSTEKPFSCTECDKTFKLKRALTVHLSQHANAVKSYKCTFCDRIFRSSTNFYTHRKNMHPQELLELKQREMEEKRKRRIEAGIEEDDKEDVEVGTDAGDEMMVHLSELVDSNDSEHVLDGLMPSVTMVRDIIIETSSGMADVDDNDDDCQIHDEVL